MFNTSSNVTCPDLFTFSEETYYNGTYHKDTYNDKYYLDYRPLTGPPVKSNADISGLGVLTGFTASAYLTLLLVLIHYAMGCVEEQNLNIIDERFLRTIRWTAHSEWKEPLGKAVLMFSDQQIVTGIALLASGYSQLPNGLDAYHWQIVVYLAWFSSFTHLTTLTVLRNYFEENPATRLWRIILMIVTVSLLGVALLPTGNQWWLSNYEENSITLGVPAICYFQGRYFSQEMFGLSAFSQAPSMIISILVLFFGYVTRMVKLWPNASEFTRDYLRTKPGEKIKKVLTASNRRSRKAKANIYWKLNRMVFEVIYIVILAHLVLWDSMLWEILWLCFALAWGTTHLFGARSSYGSYAGTTSEEDIWSFGQFLPVVLLMLPILSMAEDCYKTWRKKNTPTSKSHGSVNHANNNTINDHLQEPSNHANHVGAHQQQSQLIRIGTWPSGTSTGLPTRPLEVESHHAIARTGTNLSREEQGVETPQHQHQPFSDGSMSPSGVADTTSSNADATSPQSTDLADDSGSISHSQEVYRLEWFWVLVVMSLLLICETIVLFLVLETRGNGLQIPILEVGMALSGYVFVVITYTGFFVFLTEYHRAVGNFLFFRRPFQPMCLRVVTYSYAVLWVISIVALFTSFGVYL